MFQANMASFQTRPSARLLAVCVLLIACGLLAWRAVSVFTTQAVSAPASEFTQLVEAVAGTGNVRIAQAETGQMLVLIDGPSGALSNQTATQIRQMATLLYPDTPAPAIRQFPFADGAMMRPGHAALAELAALGILIALAAGLVLTLRAPHATSEPMQTETLPDTRPGQRRTPQMALPDHAAPDDPEVAAALQLASRDPKATAALIRTWLKPEGHHA